LKLCICPAQKAKYLKPFVRFKKALCFPLLCGKPLINPEYPVMNYRFKAMLLCITGCCLVNGLFSQSYLFKAVPDSVICDEEEISKIFELASGSTITINFSENFRLKGTVKSSVQKYTSLKSVIIESSNYQGAILSVSMKADDEESVLYSGRILSSKHDDGLELRLNDEGIYYLKKIRVTSAIKD
jgi:hypothetical protein